MTNKNVKTNEGPVDVGMLDDDIRDWSNEQTGTAAENVSEIKAAIRKNRTWTDREDNNRDNGAVTQR